MRSSKSSPKSVEDQSDSVQELSSSSDDQLPVTPRDAQTAAMPYYVKAFLMGVSAVVDSACLNTWVTSEELQTLKSISQGLSVTTLKLLARIQRRRKTCFFKVSYLRSKYQKDLGSDRDVLDVLKELERFKLVRLISQSSIVEDGRSNRPATSTGFAQSVKAPIAECHDRSESTETPRNLSNNDSPDGSSFSEAATSDIFDPLCALFSLSLRDLNLIAKNSLKGILAESVKHSKRCKSSKNKIVKDLITTANG